MRRSRRSHSLVAGVLILAMAVSVTGLFGAGNGTVVKITSPANSARVSGVVDIQASVRTSAKVSYVIFGVDDSRPGSTNSSPYTYQLDTRTLADGTHRIFCEAYDSYGMLASSKAITIHVKNGSASYVQAPKAASTQVASKPIPAPAGKAVAKSASGVARTKVAAAAVAAGEAPTVIALRGPVPEPSQPRAAGASSDAVPGLASSESRTRGHTVVLNGRVVEFDVAPRIKESRMQVGFRAMFEGTGAMVTWLPSIRTARSVNGALTVEVPADCRDAVLNGEQVDMGMPSFIEDSRLMVPLRFVGAATGSYVHWDSETHTARVDMRSRAIAQRAGAY